MRLSEGAGVVAGAGAGNCLGAASWARLALADTGTVPGQLPAPTPPTAPAPGFVP